MNAKPYALLSKNTAKFVHRIKPNYWIFIPLLWCFLFSLAWNSTATAQQAYLWNTDRTDLEDDHICEPIFDPGDPWWPNDTICVGAIDVPFILNGDVPDSCTYIWTLENVALMSIDTLDPEDVTEVLIDFPEAGEFEVCVLATNLHASGEPVCRTVWVVPLTPTTTIDTICKREPYQWLGPFGEILETYEGFTDDWGFGIDPNPGPFEDMGIAENVLGCEVEAYLELYVIPDNFPPTVGDEQYFQEVICFGDHFEMPNGVQYTETGIYGTEGEIFLPQQSFPQCDSFFILELSVLEVLLDWTDPICIENAIFIFPLDVPSPPEFLPGGAGQEIYIQWVRLSDNDTLFVGTQSAGTLLNGLVWEILPDDFNYDIETFEVTIIMDINGEPDPGCIFGPWHIEIDVNDYFSVTSEITGPETVIRDSLLTLSATHPPGEIDSALQYHWTVNSIPDEFSVVSDDSTGNFEVLFHTTGTHEVCLYVFNVDSLCGFSRTVCHEILVEAPVPVVDRHGEEWHLNIFPNPAKDHLIVESDDLTGKIEIRIIGLDGTQLKTFSEAFDKRSLIPLDGLPAGMYFIQIYREGTSVQRPFYKN